MMSAPAMKQPGLPDMRTADLAVGSAMNWRGVYCYCHELEGGILYCTL